MRWSCSTSASRRLDTDEGLRAADQIRSLYPDVAGVHPVAIDNIEVEYVEPLIANGVGHVGYLLKDRVMDPAAIIDAV